MKTERSTMIEGMSKGIPVSEGIAIGTVWKLDSVWDEVTGVKVLRTKKEVSRYQEALDYVSIQLVECRDRVKREIGSEEARIFEAHLAILGDEFFHSRIPEAVRKRRMNVDFVLKEEIDAWITEYLNQVKDEYLRLRAQDIRDVGERILHVLLQTENVNPPSGEPTIIVAHELSPSETARLHKDKILGFATELGGGNSHASILARAMGIPAVVGVERLKRKTVTGDTAIIDGHAGIVYINPSREILEEYEKRQRQLTAYWKRLSREVELPSVTADGTAVSLQANIASITDVSMAIKYKAEGIGLFRTELPFLSAGRLLSEEEQFQLYKTVLESMAGSKVVVRTLDLGGDKFLPFQAVEAESNPFMGWRSIRISLQEKDVFKAQLRAILRASAFGNLSILYPMISSLEEIHEISLVFSECKQELTREGIPYDNEISTGIMIEVPSAAIMAGNFAKHVDYFSLGTNDLIQYTLAVDRNNEKVARFYQPLNPAILHLIKNTILCADREGVGVALCGEMAGNPLYTAMFLGFGLREFSMSPVMLPEVKSRIRALSIDECRKLSDELLSLDSADMIESRLWDFHLEMNKRQAVPGITE
ncbi:phosphoenolpyruvate--protein phosphotransferase [bacterium]|nr:phosphoenolpyruvate--protein phosphotransferase [bacterium]